MAVRRSPVMSWHASWNVGGHSSTILTAIPTGQWSCRGSSEEDETSHPQGSPRWQLGLRNLCSWSFGAPEYAECQWPISGRDSVWQAPAIVGSGSPQLLCYQVTGGCSSQRRPQRRAMYSDQGIVRQVYKATRTPQAWHRGHHSRPDIASMGQSRHCGEHWTAPHTPRLLTKWVNVLAQPLLSSTSSCCGATDRGHTITACRLYSSAQPAMSHSTTAVGLVVK